MHSRRLRPTLRLLEEDLVDGWPDPFPRRCLADGREKDLMPLSELGHPLIEKALECFGDDPTKDNPRGKIQCTTTLDLMEVRMGQWRGAVWESPEGVHWLIAGGLAKGGHKDRDDFYETLQRLDEDGVLTSLRPGPEDERLLKLETSHRLLTQWELALQEQALDTLVKVLQSGSTSFEVLHPLAGHPGTLEKSDELLVVVTVTMEEHRGDGIPTDDLVVSMNPRQRWRGTDLLHTCTVRILTALSPPEQEWDAVGLTYANIAEPGGWAKRRRELNSAVKDGELVESQPGKHAHYTHRRHVAGSTIDGRAVRGLCGRFFVPTQDFESLDQCPDCEAIYENLG